MHIVSSHEMRNWTHLIPNNEKLNSVMSLYNTILSDESYDPGCG